MEARQLGSRARNRGEGPEGRGRGTGDPGEQLARPSKSCICSAGSRARSARPTSIIACARRISATRHADPAAPGLGGLTIADIDQLDALAGRRLEPAPRSAGAGAPRAQGREARREGRVPESGAFRLPVPGGRRTSSPRPRSSSRDLAAIYSACLDGAAAPKHLAALVAGAQVNTAHRAIAAALKGGPKRAIWLGALALRHPAYADLRARGRRHRGRHGRHARHAGRRRQCRGRLPRRRRAASRCRPASGAPRPARSRAKCSAAPQKAYLLFGGVEPWADGLGRGRTARARRLELRGRGHAVRRRDAQVRGARVAADLHVRRRPRAPT